jgi:hypothetical protein
MADATAPQTPTPAPPAPTNGAAPKAPEDTGAQLEATPAEPTPPEPAPELYDVVVSGRKMRLTREQLIARAQKTDAAEAQFRQATEREKQVQAFLGELESDPLAVISRIKGQEEFEKLLQGHVERRTKEATLSPEEKKLMAAEQKAAALEAKLKAIEEEKQAAAQKEQDDRSYERLEKTLLTSAAKHGIEKSGAALVELTSIALEYLEADIQPTGDQVCEEYLERQKQHLVERDKKLFSNLSPEQLIEHIGAERFEAMQKAMLAKVKGPGELPAAKKFEPKERKPSAKPFLSPSELLNRWGK